MTKELRVATFNASLNRAAEGELIDDLSAPDDVQARSVAEVIQRTDPDILLINEFDYDPAGEAAQLFQENYLGQSQGGADPVTYPYVYVAPSNTGIPSGFDLDNNGTIGGPGDAYGFGVFEGQYGMALLSKHPIAEDEIRTFQEFLWQDMPGALLPDDPATPAPGDFYTPEELAAFRLSSKSHWDVPVEVNGELVHILASHPTPPVFDGPEDRNGTRNNDEIRFWDDYITPGDAGYIYDDQGGFGGLAPDQRFVVLGDLNADPFDGDGVPGAAQQLVGNPRVEPRITPASDGGIEDSALDGGSNADHLGHPALDTADFSEPPGNLRVDYVLPSEQGFALRDTQIFWPTQDDPAAALVDASDHRLVWADLRVERIAEDQERQSVEAIEFLGTTAFSTGTAFEDTEIGGLSGLAYDAVNEAYYAIADARGGPDDGPPRFYTLSVDLGDARLDDGDVAFDAVTLLTGEGGAPFAASSLDPEGIALTGRSTLLIASEGAATDGIDPFVNEFSLAGQQFRELEVPEKFLPTADGTGGVRNNLALESLTLSPDGRSLFTATENALVQDGPTASLDAGSASRILVLDTETGTADAEYLYQTDPIPDAPIPAEAFATNGLVELLALDNAGTLLALERSFATGVGNSLRLYEVRTDDATDISGLDALPADGSDADRPAGKNKGGDAEVTPVAKDLLFDFGALGLTLDNVEGMALGSRLSDGRQSLILVSDNNFSDTQETQFLAFALDFEGPSRDAIGLPTSAPTAELLV